MARNKEKMPTISEVGPVGARKTRAAAGGYRKRVTEIQKGKATKHERLTHEAVGENERRTSARQAELARLDQAIATLETSIAKPGISSFVRESLEEQLAGDRAAREELAAQPLELVELPVEESRIIPEKEKLLEDAEREATKRDELAHELVDLAYERRDEYSTVIGLSAGSARAIDQIYFKDSQTGGFDELLYKQYVANPEILPEGVRGSIKSHLEQVASQQIEAELAEVGNLGEATLRSLREKLQARYKTPEKMAEVIAAASADEKKSILAGYSVEEPVADLLLREATAQGALAIDLARLVKMSDRSIRDRLGFQDSDRTVEPLLAAVKFFSRYMQDGDIYGHRFPLQDSQVRPVIEAVIGREIRPGGNDEDFRDRLISYVKDVERGAHEMVKQAAERGEYKNKLKEVQNQIAETIRLGKEKLSAVIEKEQPAGREAMEVFRGKVALVREQSVQLEHKLNQSAEQTRALIDRLGSATPQEFLSSGLGAQAAEVIRSLEEELAGGQINDEFYRALTANLPNAHDTGYNDYLLDKALNAYFVQEGQPGFLGLLGEEETARNWQSPELSQTVRRVEIQLDEAVRRLPDRDVIPQLFNGQDRAAIAQERSDVTLARDAAFRELTLARDAALSQFRFEVRGSNLRQEVKGLLEQKLRVARMASDRLSNLDYALASVRREKFKPIYDRLRQERTELDRKREQTEREKRRVEDRINDFEASAAKMFSMFGAGSGDRKALEKVNRELAAIGEQIEENRRQSSQLAEVFDAMNPVQQQVEKAQRNVFPSTVKR